MAGLRLDTRLTLVVGKGGVGKTSVACALALEAACAGRPTLVVSTDPAHSLSDCLAVAAGDEPTYIAEHLWALQINPRRSLEAFLERTRPALHAAIDRGTYLDDDDIADLLALPLPGIDEVTALLELMQRLPDDRWRHIVVDTAPTGHAERMLGLPEAFVAFGDLLDSLQERHRFMVTRLARTYRPDSVDTLLWKLRDDGEELRSTLHDAEKTAVILVGNVEPVVQAETERYLRWLHTDRLPISAVLVNQWDRRHVAGLPSPEAAVACLRRLAAPRPVLLAPRLRRPIHGLRRIKCFGSILAHGWEPESAAELETRQRIVGAKDPVDVASAPLPFTDRPVQFFAGKGGVGKTTLASANALALARRRSPVVLVSLDPAHSLGDVWGTPIGDAPVEVSGGIWAQEVDAARRWNDIRERWQTTMAHAADDLEGSGRPGWRETLADAERVLDLMPPGVDEVVGLFLLAELWESATYRTIVVDCAPTGHLLRLLSLPELALEWVRMLMRLTLKYREVVGLGALAEELIRLSRQLKAIHALLRDPARCAFMPVTIAEPASIEETRRLIAALEVAGMPVASVVLNKRRHCSCHDCRSATGGQPSTVDLLRDSIGYPVISVALQAQPIVGSEAIAALGTSRPSAGSEGASGHVQ